MKQIQFTIPAKAVPKGRPRMGRYGAYTPQKTRDFENLVSVTASQYAQNATEMPLAIEITFVMCPAASWSKSRFREALNGQIFPRPDIDNLAKAILDGLNGVIYADDSQIYKLTAMKKYGEKDEIHVCVKYAIDK